MSRRGFAAAALLFSALAAPARPAAATADGIVSIDRNDFPEGIAVNGAIFDVVVRYERADDSGVAACRVTRSSREPLIDQASCDIMRQRAMPAWSASRSGRMRFLWWSGDPTSENPRGAPLAISNTLWVSPGDYPEAALRHRRQGTVTYQARVAVTGSVLDCVVTGSSGTEDLDRRTCEVVSQRGRFIPAADGRGGRTEGVFRSSISWVIAD